MRKLKFFIYFLLFLAAATLTIWFFYLAPPSTTDRRFLAFSVNPAESFKSVSLRLHAEGLTRSEGIFYYLGRVTGKSGELKAGEYELNDLMSAWEILKVITGSHVKLYRVLIPEGSNMFQIAKILEDHGLVDQIQFLETCWDRTLLEELFIPSISAEGYLFPETYHISRGSSPRVIVRMFVDMFWSKVTDNYIDSAREGPLSLHESVILASVIEKETGLAGEMGLISSVFHNRLIQRMKLQSDPTAIYDISPYSSQVTREDLFRKTPFNTYSITGIPMTPISNPGILAIHSALSPQETKYIYFVSKRDGSHHFSETYEEHKAAIQRYLRSENPHSSGQ